MHRYPLEIIGLQCADEGFASPRADSSSSVVVHGRGHLECLRSARMPLDAAASIPARSKGVFTPLDFQ